MTETDLTFVLTSGGHNAGIVANRAIRPQLPGSNEEEGRPVCDPQTWQAATSRTEGSWWPAWQAWLLEHSTGPVPTPAMGCPEKGYLALSDAPGTYVQQE